MKKTNVFSDNTICKKLSILSEHKGIHFFQIVRHNCAHTISNTNCKNRSSHLEAFLGKSVLKKCSNFTVEHPCRSAISIKLQSNFIEIALRQECSSANLLYIFRTPFLEGWFWIDPFSRNVVYPIAIIFSKLTFIYPCIKEILLLKTLFPLFSSNSIKLTNCYKKQNSPWKCITYFACQALLNKIANSVLRWSEVCKSRLKLLLNLQLF